MEGDTFAGVAAQNLGNQIRLVLDLQGKAETPPVAPTGQASRSRNGRIPNDSWTNIYKLG